MLECPSCGAPAARDALQCPYCQAQLQTAQCPSCFGMIFAGVAHCSHCGAKIFAPRGDAPDGTEPHGCPRCLPHKSALAVSAIGEAILEECGRCGGLWVDAESFKKICADREHGAAYAGGGSPLAAQLGPPAHAVPEREVRYLPCPNCGQVMNRMNFARSSGVIVDVCKRHGTWFDRDELRAIVDFIAQGGLDVARNRELEQIKEESRRLESERRAAEAAPAIGQSAPSSYGDAIFAAGDLLKISSRDLIIRPVSSPAPRSPPPSAPAAWDGRARARARDRAVRARGDSDL